MSTIYYHTKKREWYQCEETNSLFFGKVNTRISYVGSKQDHSLPFSVKRVGKQVGPLVGILTGSSKDNTFIGNFSVLKNILKSLKDSGALGIVITPNSIRDFQAVEGFTFYQPLQKWIKLRTPLPNVVYNRVPYRLLEKSQPFIEISSLFKANGIPFFNPYFFSKWKVYQILKKNKFISSFLPETVLLKQKRDLEQMVIKHHDLYLKNTAGHKGLGLYRIKKDKTTFVVETANEKQIYPSLSSFWEKNEKVFVQEEFILQKAIQSDKFNGRRYDLRLLCHYNESGHFISGIGVRVAGDHKVITHVPNGGTIIPYKSVRPRFNETILQQLVYEIGKELEEQTGEFIGEFSIDLGRSLDGAIFIYEINSKPMVFDEEDIQKKGLENLTKLLIMKGTKA
ncbi:YheC/YheD family endospore coat-associated protein [Bacillus timonensis]|uniref:YheC/YheD family endospore coat-associated protein n=1 Tax=Bacillus timonensis TaxID=1033734 RepID=UPI000288592A|nr:YheC/YheD family protein [Bacillus timonensis]